MHSRSMWRARGPHADGFFKEAPAIAVAAGGSDRASVAERMARRLHCRMHARGYAEAARPAATHCWSAIAQPPPPRPVREHEEPSVASIMPVPPGRSHARSPPGHRYRRRATVEQTMAGDRAPTSTIARWQCRCRSNRPKYRRSRRATPPSHRQRHRRGVHARRCRRRCGSPASPATGGIAGQHARRIAVQGPEGPRTPSPETEPHGKFNSRQRSPKCFPAPEPTGDRVRFRFETIP